MKRSILIPILICHLLLFSRCDRPDPYRASLPEEIHGSLKITRNTLLEAGEQQLFIEFISEDAKYALRIQSSQTGERLASKLAYREKGNPWKTLSSLHIELTDKNYRKKMNAQVARQADQLRRRHPYAELDKPERILSQIPKKLFSKLSKAEYYHEVTQAVLYQWAIFKSAQRADESNATNCHCGELDTYTRGRSPFFCSEDVVVKSDRVYDMFYQLSQERNFAGKAFIPEQTLKFLKSKMGEGVSASTVNRIFKSEFHHFWNEQLTEKDRSQILKTVRAHSANGANDGTYDKDCIAYKAYWGYDCGCCGNYPGVCTDCSWICYWHDKKCIKCDLWYCGPDCTPGCPNE